MSDHDGKTRGAFTDATKGARIAASGNVLQLWFREELHGHFSVKARVQVTTSSAFYTTTVLFNNKNAVADAACFCKGGYGSRTIAFRQRHAGPYSRLTASSCFLVPCWVCVYASRSGSCCHVAAVLHIMVHAHVITSNAPGTSQSNNWMAPRNPRSPRVVRTLQFKAPRLESGLGSQQRRRAHRKPRDYDGFEPVVRDWEEYTWTATDSLCALHERGRDELGKSALAAMLCVRQIHADAARQTALAQRVLCSPPPPITPHRDTPTRTPAHRRRRARPSSGASPGIRAAAAALRELVAQ